MTEDFDDDDPLGAWDDPIALTGLIKCSTGSSTTGRFICASRGRTSAPTGTIPPVVGASVQMDDCTTMQGERSFQGRSWAFKEPFCGMSHMAGAVLSVCATLVLIFVARGRPLHVVAFALYGASLVALYTASALYHSLQLPQRAVARLQRLDHMAILLLIAGTYAPICLLSLRGAWGWSLFVIEYALALVGIAAIGVFRGRQPEWVRVALCGAMTWLVLVAINPIRVALPAAALGWLLAGLLTYTVGSLILALDWPHLRRGSFSAHDLWHLFVLGGSCCHFVLILCYVAPA